MLEDYSKERLLGSLDDLKEYCSWKLIHCLPDIPRCPYCEEIFIEDGDPHYAFWYSRMVIQGRWPEAENIIKSNGEVWKEYLKTWNLKQ